MTVRERLTNAIEPFPELNMEGKFGVLMFIGGAALLGVGMAESGLHFDDLTSLGAGVEMSGFAIASHGRRRQLRRAGQR